MVFNYLVLFLGLAQIIDGIFNLGLFSTELAIKKLGRKKTRIYSLIFGVIFVIFSLNRLLFHSGF